VEIANVKRINIMVYYTPRAELRCYTILDLAGAFIHYLL
jgi:hypothetical protein